MAEEQNQSREIMFYAGMLQYHLRRKLLKRIHPTYRPPRNLWEAFDLTLEFEKEYQITQLQTLLSTKISDPRIYSRSGDALTWHIFWYGIACSKFWIGTVLGDDQGSQVSSRQVPKTTSQLPAETDWINQHWTQP